MPGPSLMLLLQPSPSGVLGQMPLLLPRVVAHNPPVLADTLSACALPRSQKSGHPSSMLLAMEPVLQVDLVLSQLENSASLYNTKTLEIELPC